MAVKACELGSMHSDHYTERMKHSYAAYNCNYFILMLWHVKPLLGNDREICNDTTADVK
jgi:hypothetical protein